MHPFTHKGLNVSNLTAIISNIGLPACNVWASTCCFLFFVLSTVTLPAFRRSCPNTGVCQTWDWRIMKRPLVVIMITMIIAVFHEPVCTTFSSFSDSPAADRSTWKVTMETFKATKHRCSHLWHLGAEEGKEDRLKQRKKQRKDWTKERWKGRTKGCKEEERRERANEGWKQSQITSVITKNLILTSTGDIPGLWGSGWSIAMETWTVLTEEYH